MSKIKMFLTIVISSLFMFAFSLLFLSDTILAGYSTIWLPEGQVWTQAGSEDRTGNYSYLSTRCVTVYPKSGTDNFHRIQAQARTTGGTLMTNNSYYVLTEGNDITRMSIKEGFLGNSKAVFYYRGNGSPGAWTTVSYFGN